MKNKTIIFLFILIAGNIFVFGCSHTTVEHEPVAQETEVIELIPEPPSRAEQIMKAIAQGYPRQIEKIEFRNGDWTLLLRDTWYYYAEGRMLPEDMLENAENYSAQPFYNYQAELPEWVEPSSEESNRFRSMSNNRSQNPPRRSPYFFDDLWRAHNLSESDQRVKTIRFLGKSVTVHNLILEVLSLVEEEIFAAGRTDPQVQTWINNVSSLEGWMWRNIADTQSRSFHAYGLAIDIIPRSFGGKETYWLWASQNRSDWWNIPYSGRYHPPEAVIKAFEKYGFVWGGKWLYFDTMHFEYRPEVLILGGLFPETRR